MATGKVPTPGKTIAFASLMISLSRETIASTPILFKAEVTLLKLPIL